MGRWVPPGACAAIEPGPLEGQRLQGELAVPFGAGRCVQLQQRQGDARPAVGHADVAARSAAGLGGLGPGDAIEQLFGGGGQRPRDPVRVPQAGAAWPAGQPDQGQEVARRSAQQVEADLVPR